MLPITPRPCRKMAGRGWIRTNLGLCVHVGVPSARRGDECEDGVCFAAPDLDSGCPPRAFSPKRQKGGQGRIRTDMLSLWDRRGVPCEKGRVDEPELLSRQDFNSCALTNYATCPEQGRRARNFAAIEGRYRVLSCSDALRCRTRFRLHLASVQEADP